MGVEEMGEASTLTVSDQLRQAREAAGMTQASVADQLFLTETYIRHMDTGEFDRLPKQAFVRGYLRSYARVVGLDGDQLVQLYDQAFRESLPDTPADVAVSVKENRFSGPVVLTGVIGLGIVLVLVVLVWLSTSGNDRADVGAMTPAATEPVRGAQPSAEITEAASPDPANVETAPVEPEPLDQAFDQAPTSGREAPVPPLAADFERATNVVAPANQIAKAENPTLGRINQAADGLVLAVAESDPKPLALSGSDGEGLANEAEGVDQLSDQAQPSFNLDVERGIAKQVEIRRENRGDGRQILVDAGGSDELKATLVGECWIEVADSQNELIYGDLNRAGDVLILNGRAPLTVLLGNAPMASLEFNGRAIDLDSATTRDAIARLTLTN
jgi:cytoskeleton protein RodZ